jgi:kynurenine formamidase
MFAITKKIKLGNVEYLVIDLTQPLNLNVEVYPGDPKPKRKVFSDIDKTGWHHYIHELGDHSFQPHGDAPNHQNPDLKDRGFEVFDIEYCFNRAFLIDLSNSTGAEVFDGIKYLVEVKKEHLEPFTRQFSEKEAVLIRTGYDKCLEKNKHHVPENLPHLNKNAAKFIASFGNIRVVGIDSLTIDPDGSHASHQALKSILIVESLVHLYEIPLEKRIGFDLQTTPIRIVGATGGPIVAYAFIEL